MSAASGRLRLRYGREKRLLLGVLSLLAPLPLPLNEPRPLGVVTWPVLLLYVVVVGVYLRRVARGARPRLSNLSLNLLGLVYLPILALDLAVHMRSILVRPMMHLVLFVLVVKLCSIERERDKWHALVGVFFVVATSMATSASPGIVAYLAVMLVAGVVVLMRFARFHAHALAQGGGGVVGARAGSRAAVRWPLGLASTALFVAVPLFVLLPRFSQPVLSAGGMSGGLDVATGLGDEVELDTIGRVRASRNVALRVEAETGWLPPSLRLRRSAYDQFEGGRWFSRSGRWLLETRDRAFVLGGRQPRQWLRLWLEPLASGSVVVPTETTVVDLEDDRVPLRIDGGGALWLPFAPRSTATYRVGVGEKENLLGDPVSDYLDVTGVSPRVEALARQVAGDGPALERARRLETFLTQEFEYTLDLVTSDAENAIDDFLLEHRSGHCEYFATSMVLMLRAVDVPARFVTGFLGVEETPLGYGIVRQSNAHAWVEAYLPEQGWRTFDPTPPAGRPTSVGPSLRDMLRQAYDFMLFSWDRYVISYGRGDQRRVFERLAEWWRDLWSDPPEEPAPPVAEIDPVAPLATAPEPAAERDDRRPLLFAALLLLLATVAWWRRRPLTPTRAYAALRKRLGREQRFGVRPSTTPFELQHRLVAACPDVAASAEALVRAYVEESFGAREGRGLRGAPGRTRAPAEARLRGWLREIRRGVARSRPKGSRTP